MAVGQITGVGEGDAGVIDYPAMPETGMERKGHRRDEDGPPAHEERRYPPTRGGQLTRSRG